MMLMCLSLLACICCIDAFSLSPSPSFHRLVHQSKQQQYRADSNDNMKTTTKNKRSLEMRWGLKGNNPQQKIEGVSDGVNVRDTGKSFSWFIYLQICICICMYMYSLFFHSFFD